MADDITQHDLSRRSGQGETASATPACFNETGKPKVMDNFHQMVARQVIRVRNLANRGAASGRHGKMEEHAKSVVGMASQLHQLSVGRWKRELNMYSIYIFNRPR